MTVDGVYRGNTPKRIRLTAGLHRVAFEVDGKVTVQAIQVVEGARNIWTYYQVEDSIR